MILVPRHTTHVGQGSFVTLPIDVSAFDRIQLYLWRGNLVGTAPTIMFHLQQSSDKDRWSDLSVVDPGAFTEGSYAHDLTFQYLRLMVRCSATDQVSTCYAYGFLEKREA